MKKKKLLIIIGVIVLVIILLATCNKDSDKPSSGGNKTTAVKTTEHKTTENKTTASSADVKKVDFTFGTSLTDSVVFTFFAYDSNDNMITDTSAFSGSIKLTNDEGKTVYDGPATVGIGTYGSLELYIYLTNLSIEPSATPNGMAYCKLNAGGKTYESSAKIYNLPVSESSVKMPDFPLTVNMYNTQGELQKSVTVNSPKCELQSSYGDTRVILEFSGSTKAISAYPGPYGGFTLKAYYNGQEIYNQKLRAAIDENGNFSGLAARIKVEGYNGGEVTLVIEDYR